ncbi:MAG: SpoIIE family protein phosphatase, partial [Firmicutes bacterium]|nr:SpoIIE family protein phosphatase [Bacillota bacterium]
MKKTVRKRGLLLQVAILFAAGALAVGALTYFAQQVVSDGMVRRQVESDASQTSEEAELALKEYPAYEWLLDYWQAHADEMDIEYDADYSSENETERKAAILTRAYPDLQLKYADESDLQAMSEEDQKLYAEVTYSWIITRLNQIKHTQKAAFLFIVSSGKDHHRQFFLLSAADPGAKRGTRYEEVYTLGVKADVSDSQKEGMDRARENHSHLVSAGDYVDYYSWIGEAKQGDLFIGMTFDLTDIRDDINRRAIQGTAVAVLTQILLAWMCLALLNQVALQPLRRVQASIRGYMSSRDSRRFREELSEVDSSNEIGRLSEDMNDLSLEIDEHLEEIRSITSEKERINAELAMGARIQAAMLPAEQPDFGKQAGFRLAASMDPAKEVGGDFYDYFLIDEDHLCLVIADVSGKGVPAALFMMASKIILADNAGRLGSPAE